MPEKLQLLAHEQAIGRVIIDHQYIQRGFGDIDFYLGHWRYMLHRQRIKQE
ncbi:hypothetical protein D3C85_1699970 [compost metagenome]